MSPIGSWLKGQVIKQEGLQVKRVFFITNVVVLLSQFGFMLLIRRSKCEWVALLIHAGITPCEM
jgi:hypothetical protein